MLADLDTSPDRAFVPVTTPTREGLNGKAGFENPAALSLRGHFYEDEDLHVVLEPQTSDAYLAPGGDPASPWRRFCGTGVIGQFNNQEPGGPDAHPPAEPFAVGHVRPYLVEVFDGADRPAAHPGERPPDAASTSSSTAAGSAPSPAATAATAAARPGCGSIRAGCRPAHIA